MKHRTTCLTIISLSIGGCWLAPGLFPSSQQAPAILPVSANGFQVDVTGDGYFSFLNENRQIVLSRDGSLRFDVQGRVTAPNGFQLEPPIQEPPGTEITVVRADGTVFGRVPGQTADSILGNIEITRVKDPSRLRSLGNGFYLPTGETTRKQPTLDGWPALEWKGLVGEGRVPLPSPYPTSER